MKRLLLPIAGCLALLAVGCGQGKGKELSDYPNASTGDSLLYYYIQLKGEEYLNNTSTDTALRSEEQRKLFLDGVEKGISLVGDNEAYNRGLRLGVRLAINLRDFESKYDVDLNDGIMIESMRNALQEGKERAALDNQEIFYSLLTKMKNQVKTKERQIAGQALAKAAGERGLKKISDNLYYKVLRPGKGPAVLNGDVIEVAADYQRADGDNLGLPSPVTVTVGSEGLPNVMNQAYRQLSRGAMVQFATTAYQLFGSRTAIMGLKDSDVVIINMILNDIMQSSDANNPGSFITPN